MNGGEQLCEFSFVNNVWFLEGLTELMAKDD